MRAVLIIVATPILTLIYGCGEPNGFQFYPVVSEIYTVCDEAILETDIGYIVRDQAFGGETGKGEQDFLGHGMNVMHEGICFHSYKKESCVVCVPQDLEQRKAFMYP